MLSDVLEISDNTAIEKAPDFPGVLCDMRGQPGQYFGISGGRERRDFIENCPFQLLFDAAHVRIEQRRGFRHDTELR